MIHTSQPTLLVKAFERAGISDPNIRTSPLPKYPDFDPSPPSLLPSATNRPTFRSLLGDLRYPADCTRPDITFCTARLARHITAPTTQYNTLLKHTLRYLNHSEHYGTILPSSATSNRITTYSDSDYAEIVDRKSISGVLHRVYGAHVPWQSKKQSVVERSTCEAEYMAQRRALQHVVWLRQLLESMRIVATDPSFQFYMDNASVIKMLNTSRRFISGNRSM